MSKREERVVNAFIECVKNGEFSLEYAITLIEDNNKYGYLSEVAKESFYNACATPEVISVEIPGNLIDDEIEESEIVEDETVVEGG